MGNQQGYLNDANTHKHPIDGAFFAPNCLIRFGGSAQQGWRSYMEDTISIYDTDFQETGLLFFVVFDGHGGARTAQYCANNLAPYLARIIKRNGCVITQQLLSEAILEFDWSLCLTPGEAMKHMSCGTTMTLLILDTIKSKVHLAHLGDSRGIIFRSTGQLVHVTRDHNPQQPEELARILPLTAPHLSSENPFTRISLQANRVLVGDCSSLNVCRTLGDHDFKRVAGVAQIAQPVCAVIEYYEMSFADYHSDSPNNFNNGANNENPPKLCFFLASDGIWNGSITPMFQKPADPAVASASPASAPASDQSPAPPATPSKSNKKQAAANARVVNSPIFYQKTAGPPDSLAPPDQQSGSPSPIPSPGRDSTPVRSGSLAERAFSSPLMLSPPAGVSAPEPATPLLTLPENGGFAETKEPFLPMSPIPSPGGNAQMGLASPSARRGVHHHEILQHRPPPPPRVISRWDWLHGKHPNEQVVHWLMLDTMRCAHYSTSISRLFDNIIAKRNPQLGKSNDNMAAILITIEPFDFGQPHVLPSGSDDIAISSPVVVNSDTDPSLTTALDRKLTLHRDDTMLSGKLLKIIRATENEAASAPV